MLLLLLLEKLYAEYGKGTSSRTILAGEYFLDVYAAQGGAGYNDEVQRSTGGKGARVYAKFHTDKNITLTFIVGEKGKDMGSTSDNPPLGGSPDGGNSGKDTLSWPNPDNSGGGGGSTTVKDQDGNFVIVAGAGAGGSYTHNGCSGGLIRKMNCPREGNYCEEKDDSEGNSDQRGSNGIDSWIIPGAGGGGGYHGGNHHQEELGMSKNVEDGWKIGACSGSSFIDEGRVHLIEVRSDGREGDGWLTISEDYTCMYTCADCNSSTTCSRCSPGRYLTLGQCELCDSNCLECSESATYCTKCNDGKILHNGECLSECPDGTFYDSTNNICSECSDNCLTCSSSSDTCTSCKEGLILYNNKCINSCPDGTFYDSIAKICSKCSDNCLTCSTSGDTCTSCKEGVILNNNQCLTSCPNGTFYDSTTNTCSKCSDNCLTCTLKADSCTSCLAGYQLRNDNTCYRIFDSEKNNQNNQKIEGKNKSTSSFLYIIIGVLCGVIAIIIAILVFLYFHKRNTKNAEEDDSSDEQKAESIVLAEEFPITTVTNPFYSTKENNDSVIYASDEYSTSGFYTMNEEDNTLYIT